MSTRNAPLKLKPQTTALRRRMYALPVPGIMALEPQEFRPSTVWFTHENQRNRKGASFSIRHHRGKLYIIRLT